jgi:hypothetical protein
MLVMPSSSPYAHYWAGRWGNVGHLYSPTNQHGPYEHLPYALDNGAYSAYANNTEWDAKSFDRLLLWAQGKQQQPLWVAAPDVVADGAATLAMWDEWSVALREQGFTPALVVQDGMTPQDALACEAEVVFVGGSYEWKWNWVWRFCDALPRVHVGKVYSYEALMKCWEAGAESVDGTGWFRGGPRTWSHVCRFLEEQADGKLKPQPTLFDND